MVHTNQRNRRGPGNALMTVNEAAECLRFHPSTVYRLVRGGQIPALKLGKQWRVSRGAIERWAQTSHITGNATTPPRGA